ncbi:hypothetical protein AMK22_01445 [Streptomyces sp. CB01580]|nr:hypothetical protein AMK22_01445 [Streptomyces sp. CB01580]
MSRPPERTGRAPGTAVQVTVWPFFPESAAPSRRGSVRRYVPSFNRTRTSRPVSVRARSRAPSGVQGRAAVQAVPCPSGAA